MSSSSGAQLAGGIVGAFAFSFIPGVGPALGFSLGSALGGSLVQPDAQKIEGPKLDDTSVQSDSVGTPLPWIYGTQKVPGFRDWIEGGGLRPETTTTTVGGGGKGGGPPEQEREKTKYYATFTSVLAENNNGSTYRLRRLWLDAILFVDARGQDGRSDQEYTESLLSGGALVQGEGASELSAIESEQGSVSSIVLLDGSETQKPIGRMVADVGKTTAYRGRTVVYFEDLDVEKFGNRVPKVTAELVENGSGGGIEIVYSTNESELGEQIPGGEGLRIDNGLLKTNQTKDRTGGLRLDPDTVFADFILSSTGRVVDREIRDRPVTGRNEEAGDVVFPIDGFSFYDVFVSYSVRLDKFNRPETLFYYSNNANFENSDRDNKSVGCVIEFVATPGDPISWEVYDFIDRTKDPSINERIALCMTPDQNNVMVIYNKMDGSYEYERYDAKKGFSTLLESGLIKPSGDMALAATPKPNGNDKAYPMLENNVNRLWMNNKQGTTSDDVEMIIFRKQGSDYVEAFRDNLSERQSQIATGVANNGIAIFANLVAYEIVSLGVIDTQRANLSDIISNLCSRAGLEPDEYDTSQLDSEVNGYLLKQTTAISSINQIRQFYPFGIRESGYTIEFVPRGGSSVITLTDEDLQAREPSGEIPPTVDITHSSEVKMPKSVEVKYNDVNRRLEQNLQRAKRQSTNAEGQINIQAPIVFTSDGAKKAADIILKDSWQNQTKYQVSASIKNIELEPEDVITLDTDVVKADARIEKIDDGDPGIRKIQLIPEGGAQYTSNATGDSGIIVDGGISLKGPTKVTLLDLPTITESSLDPGHFFAISAFQSEWEGGSVVEYDEDGTNTIGRLTDKAIVGQTDSVLPDGPTRYWDYSSTLDITLNNGSLSSVTNTQILNGANAIAVNNGNPNNNVQGDWEIIQARDVELIGDKQYRLSTMLRGRRGTERLTGTHQYTATTIVVLSNLTGLGFTPRNPDTIGNPQGYSGVTFGFIPPSSPETNFTYLGRNLEPLSPTNVRGERNLSGDLTITWLRRTRKPKDFFGLEKAPLAEDSESYEVDILDGSDNVVRTISSSTESVTYSSSEQVNDFGSTQSNVKVKIYQLSDLVGRGWPREETL